MARDEADVRNAGVEPAPQRVQLVAPVRRDDEREIAGRGLRALALDRDEVEAELGAERADRRRDRRVADDEDARRRQHRLEEDLDRAARQARVVRGRGSVLDR